MTSSAFDRLPPTFGGTALRGDGTDEDTLRRAGATGADLFLALTEGDNRNVMAAQLGQEALGAKRTVAKINDPVRAEAYASLGIATLCRTNLMADALYEFIGLPKLHLPGVQLPTGQHPGGEHHSAAQTTVATALGGTSATPGGSTPTGPGPAAPPPTGATGTGPGHDEFGPGPSTAAPAGARGQEG
jgi:trk system potassium uptake protein TrkA